MHIPYRGKNLLQFRFHLSQGVCYANVLTMNISARFFKISNCSAGLKETVIVWNQLGLELLFVGFVSSVFVLPQFKFD